MKKLTVQHDENEYAVGFKFYGIDWGFTREDIMEKLADDAMKYGEEPLPDYE